MTNRDPVVPVCPPYVYPPLQAPTERMGNQFGLGRFYFPLNYTSPTQLVRTVQVPPLSRLTPHATASHATAASHARKRPYA